MKKQNTQNKLADWVEIFRGGWQTPSNGESQNFAEDFLDEVIANHEPAPHVIGHPDTTAPAYGWTSALKRDGLRLFARSTNINPDFSDAVGNRSFPNRSASFRKTPKGWQLQHVGWLGGKAPAIKGLQPAFAEFDDNAELLEFEQVPHYVTGGAVSRAGGLFRRLREWFIDEKGLEAADKLLPSWEIEDIEERGTRISNTPEASETAPAFAEADAESSTPKNHDKETQEADMPKEYTEAEIEQLKADAAAAAKADVEAEFSERLNTAESALETTLKAQRAEKSKSLIESWKAAGKLLPAQEKGLAEFMEAQSDDELSFSEGDTEIKKPANQWFIEFMEGLPKQIVLGQSHSGDDSGVDGYEPSPKEIREFAEANGVSNTEARSLLIEQKAA